MFSHFLSFIKENVSTKETVMIENITLKGFLIKMSRACKQFNTPTQRQFSPQHLVSEEHVFNILV